VSGDRAAEKDGDLRVIDESGEDYLFAADRFVSIEVPTAVKASTEKIARSSRRRRTSLRGQSNSINFRSILLSLVKPVVKFRVLFRDRDTSLTIEASSEPRFLSGAVTRPAGI